MASFYINKYGKNRWRLMEQVWNETAHKYAQRTVPREAFQTLGFNPAWTVEEARARVKQLNAENSEKRKVQHQATAAATRASKLNKYSSIYAPVDLSNRFIEHLKADSFGGEKHKARLVIHFNKIQRLVRDLKLEANSFYDRRNEIYRYFIDNPTSLDSVATILRVMNKWADFVCRERKQYYREIEAPRGQVRAMIADAYQDSEDYRGESDPLTPQMLAAVKEPFAPAQHNWLHLTIWLGLRPSEATGLHSPKNYKITEKDGVPILHVYQPKLTALERDKRWKLIPLLFPEQRRCIEIIQSGQFEAPLVKTVQKRFGDRVRLYGGRKGFVALMRSRGQELVDISMWLGHQSIERTWKDYRDKTGVSWTG